jgi:uncharacterized lipoprotein YbaY
MTAPPPPAQRTTFRLTGGPTGEVEGIVEDRLRLDASAPVPPGSRVEGVLEGAAGALSIRGKVIGAARGAVPGRFVVTIKLADLSRSDRVQLARLTAD